MPLLRIAFEADLSAVPESISNVLSGFIRDGFFGYSLATSIHDMEHTFEDGWERVPADGVIDIALSTGTKSFYMDLHLIPTSEVDPDAPESKQVRRVGMIGTNDFKPILTGEYQDLVKKFPDGFFVLAVVLKASYILIPVAWSTTFEAEIARTNINGWEIIYHAHQPPITGASGKVLVTNHDVVYWSSDLHLIGRKYLP
jgi:hypothetical protein